MRIRQSTYRFHKKKKTKSLHVRINVNLCALVECNVLIRRQPPLPVWVIAASGSCADCLTPLFRVSFLSLSNQPVFKYLNTVQQITNSLFDLSAVVDKSSQ